jgi:hypothetical protein
MFIESFRVESPNVRYGPSEIESEYRYDTTELVHEGKDGASRWVVRPKSVKYNFRTSTAVPKLGYVRNAPPKSIPSPCPVAVKSNRRSDLLESTILLRVMTTCRYR